MTLVSYACELAGRCLLKTLRSAGLLVLALAALRTASADDAKEAGKYQGPSALAASKDGKTLFVACTDAREVAWVALPGGKVLRRIAVPAEPTGLALSPDGKKLVVTCAAPRSSLVILDAASGALLSTIRLGHTAMAPTVSPDGRWLYVCNRFDNDVSIVDLKAAKETTPSPRRARADRGGARVRRQNAAGGQPLAQRADRLAFRRGRAAGHHGRRYANARDRLHPVAARGQQRARHLRTARRPTRAGDAPAVELRGDAHPRRRGLDQHERGQHHRPPPAQGAPHARAWMRPATARAIRGTWSARPTGSTCASALPARTNCV